MLLFTHARPPSGLPVRQHASLLTPVHDGSRRPRFLVIGVSGARVDVVLLRFLGRVRDDRFGGLRCWEFRLRAVPRCEAGLIGGKRETGERFLQKTSGEKGSHGYRNFLWMGGRKREGGEKGRIAGRGGSYLWTS